MILGWSKVTRSGKNGRKKFPKKKIWKIRPNGTGKWVVEVLTSQVVLSGTLYCLGDKLKQGTGKSNFSSWISKQANNTPPIDGVLLFPPSVSAPQGYIYDYWKGPESLSPEDSITFRFHFLHFSNLAVVLCHYCLSLVKKKKGDILLWLFAGPSGFRPCMSCSKNWVV